MKKIVKVYANGKEELFLENILSHEDAVFELQYEIGLWKKAGGDVCTYNDVADFFEPNGKLVYTMYILNQE